MSDWLTGAVAGAGAGAAFGGWGAIPGALIGGIIGAKQKPPKSAEDMGLTQFDALAESKKYMPSEADLNSQRNAFNAGNNQNIDEYAKQLISSGMNPQQAFIIAQNKYSTNVNKYEATQQRSLSDQQNQLTLSLLGRQFEREDDIASYDNMIASRPTFEQQAGLLAGATNLFRAQDGNNWLFNQFSTKP